MLVSYKHLATSTQYLTQSALYKAIYLYAHSRFADSIAAILQFKSKNHHIVMPFCYNMIIYNKLNVSFRDSENAVVYWVYKNRFSYKLT